MADDMGYECLGANGSSDYPTPHLDRLAESGMRFEHCHSQPLCTPSRVQIMTGIYNHRNYVRFGYLDPDAVTFGHVMKGAGYATAVTGKWQLGGGFEGPGAFGFDEYCLWQLTRRPNRYPNPGLEINGEERDFKPGGYGPLVVNDYAIDFIRRHKRKRFFLYYPMILPHWPFEPTPDSEDWDPRARIDDALERSGGPHTSKRHFREMLMYADKMVGRLVAALEAEGLRDETVILFTADNGTHGRITSRMRDGREVIGGKGRTSDNGTHVPLIVSWPDVVEAGSVNRDLVDFSDFLPTLAEITGAELPAGLRLDGLSFAPQLRGERGEPRRHIYCWYERNGERERASQHVRTVRYKLYGDGRFFDTEADPYEERPLDVESLSGELLETYETLSTALHLWADLQPSATRCTFGPPFTDRHQPWPEAPAAAVQHLRSARLYAAAGRSGP